MPFLRLTRDRRGIENTFLLHATHPGERPRVLYWYRTAPGVGLGRPPLDEEAIRTIEDNHPDIDFDWPAILALSEVMTPEDEVEPERPKRKGRRDREGGREPRAAAERHPSREPEPATAEDVDEPIAEPSAIEPSAGPPTSRLLEELVGREIAVRLRARYAEIRTVIDQRVTDPEARERFLRDAESLDPDRWETPEAVLEGVSGADARFDRLRANLLDGAS